MLRAEDIFDRIHEPERIKWVSISEYLKSDLLKEGFFS